MESRTTGWLIGLMLLAISAAQLPPLCLAWVWAEPWQPFAWTAGPGLLVGAVLVSGLRKSGGPLSRTSVFVTVVLLWGLACLLGALPFLLHPAISLAPIDALFESTSGFTTTGASVLAGLDRLPRSLVLWRCSTQWLGGIGTILLGVLILPVLGVGGMQLFRPDASGLVQDKIASLTTASARLLGLLYAALSLTHALLLYFGGMTLFDAVCHAMTTISTGGFSTHSDSLAHYGSPYLRGITVVWMLIGGTSFALLHRAMTQGISWSAYPELRLYFAFFLLTLLLLAIDLRSEMPQAFPNAAEALDHAAFQAASALTTTGHSTRDIAGWPATSRALLFVLVIVGGMAGSTSGGLKVLRVLLMAQFARRGFFRLVHPHGISTIRLGNRSVDDAILESAASFVVLWFIVLFAGTCLVAATGPDFLSSASACTGALSNIGTGLRNAGPSQTWAQFTPFAKLVLMSLMLLGRLELYTLLILFSPDFWRR